MRRCVVVLLVLVLGVGVFAQGKPEVVRPDLKVAMITDGGRIDDESFNQGLWMGVLQAQRDYGLVVTYVVPSSVELSSVISSLVSDGYGLILCVGSSFSSVLSSVQDKYPSVFFVQFDGAPSLIGSNLSCVTWCEQDASFLAGVAASVEIVDGTFCFVGGKAIPAVQRYEEGWKQGIAYANAEYGTNITQHDSVYLDSFTDEDLGNSVASELYASGVSVIFSAAGGAGNGVIAACRKYVSDGNVGWAVGVDQDQSRIGLLSDRRQSVVLTSAIKDLQFTSYAFVQSVLYGKFPGGQAVVMNLDNKGVGLPEKNPNLSKDTMKEVKKAMKRRPVWTI